MYTLCAIYIYIFSIRLFMLRRVDGCSHFIVFSTSGQNKNLVTVHYICICVIWKTISSNWQNRSEFNRAELSIVIDEAYLIWRRWNCLPPSLFVVNLGPNHYLHHTYLQCRRTFAALGNLENSWYVIQNWWFAHDSVQVRARCWSLDVVITTNVLVVPLVNSYC